MISRMAVGETPSPSLDCLNFLMAMDLPLLEGDLVLARNTSPYVPSPIFPIRSYCCNHAGLLLPLPPLPPPPLLLVAVVPSPILFSLNGTQARKTALGGSFIYININYNHLLYIFPTLLLIYYLLPKM